MWGSKDPLWGSKDLFLHFKLSHTKFYLYCGRLLAPAMHTAPMPKGPETQHASVGMAKVDLPRCHLQVSKVELQEAQKLLMFYLAFLGSGFSIGPTFDCATTRVSSLLQNER